MTESYVHYSISWHGEVDVVAPTFASKEEAERYIERMVSPEPAINGKTRNRDDYAVVQQSVTLTKTEWETVS